MPGLDNNGFNECYPDFPNIDLNSPNGSIILDSGIPIYNDVDVNGTGAEVITNIFSFDAEFDLKKLWLVITDATDITVATHVYFDIWDGANSVILTLDGLDMSGVNVRSKAIKNADDSVALILLNASQVRYVESAFNKAFVGGFISEKASTTCYVRLRVTTDANTDITVRVFMAYSPLDFTLNIAAV